MGSHSISFLLFTLLSYHHIIIVFPGITPPVLLSRSRIGKTNKEDMGNGMGRGTKMSEQMGK